MAKFIDGLTSALEHIGSGSAKRRELISCGRVVRRLIDVADLMCFDRWTPVGATVCGEWLLSGWLSVARRVDPGIVYSGHSDNGDVVHPYSVPHSRSIHWLCAAVYFIAVP